MKKPHKPLVYLVHPSLLETDEIKERMEKGHTINGLELSGPFDLGNNLTDADLVLGPNCFRLSKETINLLPLAEKAARNSKYPPKAKGAKNETE